ncbi:helix-turn-helix domain-containing protein [Candidatus Bathyarchaeota archaeon]|nr:helix-turn-helix domain-containing protein [Candidatus Bathyarchaeota archaeon]
MPPSSKRAGSRVLKAASSSLRLNILKLLFDRGPLSYTEIMKLLKLSPSKDAGRFAYHLKVLLNLDLIEPDAESKKYMLTEMGKSLVDFANRIEERTLKKRMLVRTSRLSIEPFDRNKIAESLIREAGVPFDLAHKIARETEERLLKLDTKYLTAPLIREFVNAILIERGLEEYRHKLTRLGLPVYDVTQLIKSMGAISADVEAIRAAAGNRVIEEYTLLNTLPRDIADAHLSGTLNLNNLASWILKIDSFVHDLRFFFKYGLVFKEQSSDYMVIQPPKSFRAALNLIVNILRIASTEISREQGLEHFNVFLAPFIKGLSENDVRDEINLFLSSINLTVPTGVSISVDLRVPEFLSEHRAIGPRGDVTGVYGDYAEESLTLASLIVEALGEACKSKAVFNPSPIIKLYPGRLSSEEEGVVYGAHSLASYGPPYFVNLLPEGEERASHLATGERFPENWKRDWELDTVRVGCMGSVTVNLPRAFYEAKGNREAFFSNIYDFMEKALRALEIKFLTIKQRAYEGLLPLLSYGGGRDPYCRLGNSLFLVSIAGLNETISLATKRAIYEGNEPLKFAEEISSYLVRITSEFSKRREMRCALSLTLESEASRRMATLDLEHYGLAEVNVSGSKDRPYYSDLNSLLYNANISLDNYLAIEERLHTFFSGRHLIKIPIRGESPEELLSISRKITSGFKIPLYTFDTTIVYCSSCHKTFRGEQSKCPICGSTGTITRFIREDARYKAAPY